MVRASLGSLLIIVAAGWLNRAMVSAQVLPRPNNDSVAILVNKSHPLHPPSYVPPNLTVPMVWLARPSSDPEMLLSQPAATALVKLFTAAQAAGNTLVLSSGYRSYEDQANLYDSRLRESGIIANESVASAGYSEHQTGLAADVITFNYFCAGQGCFALTTAAAWLSQHAYSFGFVVRYPLNRQLSTGYEYEPWHIRYVGISLAKQLQFKHETLEEFYGLP